ASSRRTATSIAWRACLARASNAKTEAIQHQRKLAYDTCKATEGTGWVAHHKEWSCDDQSIGFEVGWG
ncbi:MAG: hypothetical protein KC492_13120, partial [Myxococcales bacterium]|nr:hypothetical protein [Myxococcales bacterium]